MLFIHREKKDLKWTLNNLSIIWKDVYCYNVIFSTFFNKRYFFCKVILFGYDIDFWWAQLNKKWLKMACFGGSSKQNATQKVSPRNAHMPLVSRIYPNIGRIPIVMFFLMLIENTWCGAAKRTKYLLIREINCYYRDYDIAETIKQVFLYASLHLQ